MLWMLLCWTTLAAVEIPYDGIDQDGDGVDLVDRDLDGWPSELAGGRDCNDRDPEVHPGVRDRDGDRIDADCDGWDGDLEYPKPPLGPLGPLLGSLVGMGMLLFAQESRSLLKWLKRRFSRQRRIEL